MRTRTLRGLASLTSLSTLAAVVAVAPSASAARPQPFDLQAHRGGLALTVENTVPAFERALRLGVTTLELDVQITRDRQAVVTHDRVVSGAKCRDTAPARPGDRAGPTSATTSSTSPWPKSAPSTAAPAPWRSTPASRRSRARGCPSCARSSTRSTASAPAT